MCSMVPKMCGMVPKVRVVESWDPGSQDSTFPFVLHDFFVLRDCKIIFLVPRGCMIFLSWEIARFFCPERWPYCFFPRCCVILFCPKRLRDFFVPRGCMICLVVPRGCVIFLCPERLRVMVGPAKTMNSCTFFYHIILEFIQLFSSDQHGIKLDALKCTASQCTIA